MACGVPVVLSDIPSYRSFSVPCDYAEFPVKNTPEAMAKAIIKMIEDAEIRKYRIKRGIEVAGQFSYDNVAKALEGVFRLASTDG